MAGAIGIVMTACGVSSTVPGSGGISLRDASAKDSAAAASDPDGDDASQDCGDADLTLLHCGSATCVAATQGCCIPDDNPAKVSCLPKGSPCAGTTFVCAIVFDGGCPTAQCTDMR